MTDSAPRPDTPREAAVRRMALDGYSYAEIADALGIVSRSAVAGICARRRIRSAHTQEKVVPKSMALRLLNRTTYPIERASDWWGDTWDVGETVRVAR